MSWYTVDIRRVYNPRELNKSLSIPSSIHSFSVCIEYMRDWFLDKFPKNYFKTVYIDSKHVVDDFRNMSKTQMLKRQKPMLAIVPQLDFAFDREKIDSYQFGLELYNTKGGFRNSFFKDKDKNIYLGIGLQCDLVKYNFRMKFSTRAQQMDMYKYIKMACRAGYTQGKRNDIDFHVPYGLMLQIAKDAGFHIKNDKIINVIDFLHYLNMHSQMTFLYKFRCINGNDEFFLRVPDLYTHIRVVDITADDGEREGQIHNNYGIELEAEIRFPSPQLYAYYSELVHDKITLKEEIEDTVTVLNVIKLGVAPDNNDKGWPQYLTTEYAEEDRSVPLKINFYELFENNEIGKVIKYNNSISISSDVFLDIKVYNNGELIESDVDWKTMTLTTKKPVDDIMSFIAIYADADYLHNTSATIDDMSKNRIK